MGAGSVGCYLGGLLAAQGLGVVFVGRPRITAALREQGLRLSDLNGRDLRVPARELQIHESIPAGIEPSLVLLCVKSGATETAAAELAAALPAGTPVVSMQNGIGNAERGRAAAPGLQWLAGMVPFNIAELGAGHFHRGTAGALMAEQHAALEPLRAAFSAQGVGFKLLPDLRGVQWGKLLLNLNNPVNALSGKPLREQLLQRGYRRCLAALQQEALQALKAAGIAPAQLAALPPQRVPLLLRLPTWLFQRLAKRMLQIDAKARSSMADDLLLGRPTEIDALCGEVVRLAERHGCAAPLNTRVCELVRQQPQRGRPYGPDELVQALGLR
ncbi:2-dehydropantoate 2-reductase [Pelomonas sp. SE-A7]|uniref:2-dehydropantoate 2-reductase n=1 Tax=Pelomonas sp. SE-A7 TaxID=3054953 RepID=UPI00259CCA3D|nr:2-dehydropantoate 2-reductase [Pelomonas sp. SE-A7]MDM4765861.1 2-dehydropantoate 2-reductase [Pelomonas sp. SE-A7]